MNEKRFNARFTPKGDTEANWNRAVGFVPLDKEIIIYKPDENHSVARIKVGDGVTVVQELPFSIDKSEYIKIMDAFDNGELKGEAILYLNESWGGGEVGTTWSHLTELFNHTPRIGDLVITSDGMLCEVLGYVGVNEHSCEVKLLASLKGEDGKDYVLTSTDKAQIVSTVLTQIPLYDGTITVIGDDTQ